MKIYTSTQYTGKTKRKKLLRILLILTLTAGILTGAAVLGNLLKDRLENAAALLALSPEDYTVRPNTDGAVSFDQPPRKRPSVEAVICGAFDPALYGSEEDLPEAVSTAAELWGGISVTVTDGTGARFLLDALKDTADANAAQKSLLADTAEAAAGADLYVSATVYSTRSAQTDGEILAELLEYGIRDVMLCGFSEQSLTAEDAYTLLVYLSHLRDRAPDTAVGIALSPALFADAASAAALDQLTTYFDYLALDLTDPPEEYGSAAAYAAAVSRDLYGSLAYYDLAILAEGGDGFHTVLPVWTDAGVTAIRCLS